MEGLEINIVSYSGLFSNNNDVFRFDSEHYQKRYRNIVSAIKKHSFKSLSDLIVKPVITGHTPSMKIDEYYDGNIKFIKTDNLRENKIVEPFSDTLSHKGNQIISKSSLKPNDIITTIIGATHSIVGRTSIIQKEILPANINQNIALIRVEDEEVNPDYLNIFLNTKYGRGLLHWQSRQTGQVNLNCREVERIIVPIFKILENEVEILVKKIEQLKVKISSRFQEAIQIMSEELRLNKIRIKPDPVNIYSLSKSFLWSGRLDAEYYQAKYDQYEDLITSYKNGYELFNEVCNLRDKNYKPEDKQQYKYIELANIGKSGEITDCTLEIGEELPTRARRKVKTNDVIISSIEGSLESCALVTPEYDNALCSTGFYVVNSTKINPETLLVLFKSEPLQNLLKKGCSGTILTAINKSELAQIPIPLIDRDTQKKIKTKVSESFKLRDQSEHLLETAKRAVEIAIEENEKTALEYIEKKSSL